MLATLLTIAAAMPQAPAALPLSTSERTLDHLGMVVRDERSLDPTTGRIVRRTTDAATGAPVDADAMLVAEAAKRDADSGKIWHALQQRLAAARPDDTLQVVFWLHRSANAVDLRGVLDAATDRGMTAADARRAALAAARQQVDAVAPAFVAAVRAAGHRVLYADPYVPIVFVELPAKAVAGLAARADVDQAFYSFPRHAPEEAMGAPMTVFNGAASPSARTDFVHRKGITGQGVDVMVNDVGGVAPNNPYLPTVISGASTAIDSHSTAVAGIISAHHEVYFGAANGLVRIFDHYGYDDIQTPMAWSWGMQQGISFGNCSWWNFNRGSIVFLDRYFDYIIRNFGVMMFKSCGNQGNNQPTTSPGNGFNCTASGNADDRNTFDWDDDVMQSSSSTANPQPSNHEKPEITAHGTNITTTTTRSPWIGNAGTGTSFASPVSCGTAALLAETDPLLKAKPEVVKAALMAGAWNNVHGAAPLSDWDGAGAIDAAASQSAIADGQYLATTLTPASFTNGLFRHPIQLDAGDETRIVALWFSEADSSYATDTLRMDLDMTVEDPSGSVVASSASSANPFEIVQFVPATTGTYTVVLQQQRFLGQSEPLAIVWTTGQDAATDAVNVSGTPSIGSTLQITWLDRYHPGATYVGLLSATPYPATLPVGANRILPIGYDGLTAAVLAGVLPGFVGTHSKGGFAMTSLPLPAEPGLVGVQIYAAMVTLQTGNGSVEETSAATSITIQ